MPDDRKGRSAAADKHASEDQARSVYQDPLNPLSDEDLNSLTRRLKVARQLRRAGAPSRDLVESVAEAAGVHPSTVYRDLARIEGNGSVRNLAPRKRGFPKGQSRLHPRQDEIILQRLTSYYLQPAQPSLADTTEKIGDDCEGEGFTRPSRATVIRRLKDIPQRQVTLRRKGEKEAEKLTPRPGALVVERPRDMYQIDHTLADVIVLDSEHLKPIGRPWLTVVIDVCSRMVVGFWVAFEPPSIVRAGTAMDLAVRPKSQWLAGRGLDYSWPAEGLPRIVHSDNGSDLRAAAFRRGLMNQGVDVRYRPLGQAHWGGHVERLNGTLMGRCRLLPGATHNSPRARGGYDSKASARVVIDELELWFAHEILGRYHNTPHSGLNGATPLEVWERGTAGCAPLLPDDPEEFRIDLLPEERRTITRQGISLFNEEYYSPALGEALSAGHRDVKVKYDPRDRSEIYVSIRGQGYIPVPPRFPHRVPPPPLWLAKAARGTIPRDRRGDRATVRRANEQAIATIEEASAKSAKANRQAERLRHDRRSVAEIKAGWIKDAPAGAPPDDDWGGAFAEGDQ